MQELKILYPMYPFSGSYYTMHPYQNKGAYQERRQGIQKSRIQYMRDEGNFQYDRRKFQDFS